jgi:hypothetical protein
MKAREYTSPLIEKLLSEVTPEEMEKTEQLMEAMNNKQQTAVEWLHDELFKSFQKFHTLQFTMEEYQANNVKLYLQAKEMEKERIETAYNKGTVHGIDYPESTLPITGEQYYEQTYGGGEQ